MRKIILLAAACCLLQSTFAESIFPFVSLSQFSLLVQTQIEVVPGNIVQKKMPLKERLLMKWYKKKMNRTVSEEKQKKNVKLLGFFSLGAGLLSPILLLISFIIGTEAFLGVAVVLILLLIPTAIILGIIGLSKRKKLADKTGTSKLPALIGIILGSLFIVGLLISLLTFSYSGSI